MMKYVLCRRYMCAARVQCPGPPERLTCQADLQGRLTLLADDWAALREPRGATCREARLPELRSWVTRPRTAWEREDVTDQALVSAASPHVGPPDKRAALARLKSRQHDRHTAAIAAKHGHGAHGMASMRTEAALPGQTSPATPGRVAQGFAQPCELGIGASHSLEPIERQPHLQVRTQCMLFAAMSPPHNSLAPAGGSAAAPLQRAPREEVFHFLFPPMPDSGKTGRRRGKTSAATRTSDQAAVVALPQDLIEELGLHGRESPLAPILRKVDGMLNRIRR